MLMGAYLVAEVSIFADQFGQLALLDPSDRPSNGCLGGGGSLWREGDPGVEMGCWNGEAGNRTFSMRETVTLDKASIWWPKTSADPSRPPTVTSTP